LDPSDAEAINNKAALSAPAPKQKPAAAKPAAAKSGAAPKKN
jgi:hypothetical protein